MRDEETGRCTCCGRIGECACSGEPDCHPAPSALPLLLAVIGGAQQVAKRSRFGGRR